MTNIHASRRFMIYLFGRHFNIITDCNSLTLTLTKIELNPRIARWALDLQKYDYDLILREGNRMQHVFALSRCTNILTVEINSFEDNLVICQAKDPKVQKIKKQLEKRKHKLFEMRNGIVYRKSNDDILLLPRRRV